MTYEVSLGTEAGRVVGSCTGQKGAEWDSAGPGGLRGSA